MDEAATEAKNGALMNEIFVTAHRSRLGGEDQVQWPVKHIASIGNHSHSTKQGVVENNGQYSWLAIDNIIHKQTEDHGKTGIADHG